MLGALRRPGRLGQVPVCPGGLGEPRNVLQRSCAVDSDIQTAARHRRLGCRFIAEPEGHIVRLAWAVDGHVLRSRPECVVIEEFPTIKTSNNTR